MLYPGQVVKVIQRSDFTLNKDIDEDFKSPEHSEDSPEMQMLSSAIVRNRQGEISDLGALQRYISGIRAKRTVEKYESIVKSREKYVRRASKEKAVSKQDSRLFLINLEPENMEEEEEEIEQSKKLEIIAQELEKMKGGNYDVSCSILVGMKEYVDGLLRISSDFLSFEPTESGRVILRGIPIGTVHGEHRAFPRAGDIQLHRSHRRHSPLLPPRRLSVGPRT